jgi:hypothetical protein
MGPVVQLLLLIGCGTPQPTPADGAVAAKETLAKPAPTLSEAPPSQTITPPETSDALARQANKALKAITCLEGFPFDEECPKRPMSKKTLLEDGARWIKLLMHHEAFSTLGEGLDLDQDVSHAITAYWHHPPRPPLADKMSECEWRAAMVSYHPTFAKTYQQYRQTLEKRLEVFPQDTAAQGLLALSTKVSLRASNNKYYKYPRLYLANEHLLDGRFDMPASCSAFVDLSDCPEQNTKTECAADRYLASKIYGESNQQANAILGSIAQTNPNTPWLKLQY